MSGETSTSSKRLKRRRKSKNRLLKRIQAFPRQTFSISIRFRSRMRANLNHTPTQAEISPIHLAAYKGHIELSRHLLEESGNKKVIGICQLTSLHYAALGGHCEVFKLFYAFAEVKNPKLSDRKNTPFHLAAFKGHLDICKFIIEREDDKN